MSKFANIFLKTLNEEKEGNAFTAKLAKTKKGEKFKLGNKHIKDTSDYDDSSVKEGKKHSKHVKKTANKFKKTFTESLRAEAMSDEEPSDEEVWKRSLDKGTNPDDFNVEDNPQINIDTSGVEAARKWIEQLEKMAEFVNGTGPESLNSKINELEVKNSIPFRGVVRREEKRITKVAENLRGLAEVFKSVVITSQKKIKDANER